MSLNCGDSGFEDEKSFSMILESSNLDLEVSPLKSKRVRRGLTPILAIMIESTAGKRGEDFEEDKDDPVEPTEADEIAHIWLYQDTLITLSIWYLLGSRDALVSTSSVSALATSSSTSKMCVWPMQGHLQLASSGFEDIDVPHAVLADIVQVYFDPAAGEQAVTIPQGVFQVNGRDMMIILVPRESKTMTLYAHSVPNHTISPISRSLPHHIDEEQHQSKLQAYSQLPQQGFLIPHQSCMDRSDAKLEASREGTPETGVVMPTLDDREYGETAGLEGGTIPVTPGGARYELVGDDDAALCAGPEAGPVGIKVGAAQFAMPWNPGMALRDCGPDSCCENAGGYDAGGYY
ncbi:hypothetical protein BKA93DRAFT_746400 [Sparassis latifolia]